MSGIQLSDVTLWRRTQEEFSYDFKRTVFDVVRGTYRSPARRRVLNRVNLTIARGEKVALIGPNGSGKSTLLKVICGILQPTTGTVEAQGSIAPLIELGAGFDHQQSLIENIIFYGVLLGFTRDHMKARVEAILEFAELTKHADEPFKAMSSGMAARLGFALVTEVRPDILMLDEVLSVGDEHFRIKCDERIRQYWNANTTVILVSHDMHQVVKQCERAIWLENGAVIADGPSAEVTRRYIERVHGQAHAPAVPA